MRTVSIIPGIDAAAPERTDTSSGSAGSPRVLPMAFSSAARCSLTWASSSGGRAAVLQVVAAGVGGDREAGRDGQAQVGHLGEVRALAAEQVLLVLAALAEVVDPLRRRLAGHR